ncbi:VRR-NUC domain-containing protein [Lysobacter sp. HA35]
MTRQLEHVEAVLLMRWVRGMEGDYPELAFFAAVPNGGKRGIKTGRDLKAEGVRRGVPDYLWPCTRGGYCGLAIELKTDTGRASPEQRAWLAHLRAQGWRAEVARGWEQARDLVLDYLALEALAA